MRPDSIGTNNGSLQGAISFTNGICGKALLCNGGYVNVPDSPKLSFVPGSSATLSVWAYRTGENLPFHIFGKRIDCYGDSYLSDGINYQLGVGSDAAATPLNQWLHLVGTYRGGSIQWHTNGVPYVGCSGGVNGGAYGGCDFGIVNSAPFMIGGSGTCAACYGRVCTR